VFVERNPQSLCRFAIARAEITPPVGIYHRMWGAATHDRSEGVHRPLYATAMLFKPLTDKLSTDDAFFLITLDLCVMCDEELDPIIESINEATGMDRSKISVTFAHTHGVGRYSSDRVELPGGALIPEYLQSLDRIIAELATACLSSTEEVRMHYGSGRCRLAANRDFFDPASKRYVCGYNPNAEADDEVVMARISRPTGALVATVVNYACHPTSLAWGNRLLSPDFPGAMRELVEEATSAPCVFIQGASGELGPRVGYSGDVEVADRNGRQLGYAAMSVFESIPPVGTDFEYTGSVESGALLGTWADRRIDPDREVAIGLWEVRTEVVDLPYREGLPTVTQLEADLARWSVLEAAGSPEKAPTKNPRAEAEKAKRSLERRRSLPDGKSYPFRTSLMRIGDAIWVSVQGEPYSLLQTELRKRFPDFTIVVASISNSWGPSYLPPAKTYGSGRYQEQIAILAPGCLETLIDHLADTITEMVGK
jgi:hypothetical protein